jgi:hypothetical protein
MHERFDVMRLWKKVKKLDGFDFVARSVWFCTSGHAPSLQENSEIACKR